MKILLFGGSGQLGFEIRRRALDLNFSIIAPVISEVDIANRQQVLFLAEQSEADLIINCAAYTAVDKAEEEREEAYRINERGAANVADVTKTVGSRLIHISTDYVFDGTIERPLREDDPAAPLNVYGASKLAGEKAVLATLGERALVVRTSSLHGQKGINFVDTMLKLFETRDQVTVVQDQSMSPTWAGWLAEAILDLGRIQCAGVLHASGAGVTSWYEFASTILELARPKLKNPHPVQVLPIAAKDFGRPARRPMYSVLDCTRLTTLLGRKPLAWQEGLKMHLTEVGYL